MYPTLFFGVLTTAAALRYALAPTSRLVPLQLSLAVLTLTTGALGFVTGLIKVSLSMPRVSPEQRWIWMLGLGEALQNVSLALLMVLLASLATALGAWRFSRSSQP